MAKFLALDFDNEQLLVVSATTKSAGLRIQRALAWEEKLFRERGGPAQQAESA